MLTETCLSLWFIPISPRRPGISLTSPTLNCLDPAISWVDGKGRTEKGNGWLEYVWYGRILSYLFCESVTCIEGWAAIIAPPISAFVTRTEWNKWIVMDSVDPSPPAEVSLFKCGLTSHSFPTPGMCSPGRPTLINFSSKWQGCGQKRSCLPAVRVAWCAMERVSFDILQTYFLCLTATMYFKMCHFINLSL